MMKRVAFLVATFGVAIVLAGCQTTPTQQGAVVGGALGAGVGAIVGNQSGHPGTGALIGAGAGGVAGALIGEQVGERQRERAISPAPAQTYSQPVQGHYETRIVEAPNGEKYEERVWIPDR